jgi:uncharacterized LabA/DUF88 family protein
MDQAQSIALLIDCDNASASAIEGVLNELATYGVINVRRAYGNWKNPHLKHWEAQLHPYAIMPIQQFAFTQGKNATDAAMIIDAMDLLYTRKLDAFALLTSDSDFTPLAMRILTSGLKVYGFGEKKTPLPFVNACSRFIFTENLEEAAKEDQKTAEPRRELKKNRTELRRDEALVNLLRTAAEQTAEDDGWSNFGRLAQYISNNTSFSPINFGYKKWSDLIKVSELFQYEMRNNSVMYIKDVRKPARE